MTVTMTTSSIRSFRLTAWFQFLLLLGDFAITLFAECNRQKLYTVAVAYLFVLLFGDKYGCMGSSQNNFVRTQSTILVACSQCYPTFSTVYRQLSVSRRCDEHNAAGVRIDTHCLGTVSCLFCGMPHKGADHTTLMWVQRVRSLDHLVHGPIRPIPLSADNILLYNYSSFCGALRS
ncbi:hypothetical protein BC832DRAFT_456515 [Gaertneriomyces semiglobifer]|nr:hypothetical protein BC832DRAFT_456515 [Gaertneriomyces semiglobifer]